MPGRDDVPATTQIPMAVIQSGSADCGGLLYMPIETADEWAGVYEFLSLGDIAPEDVAGAYTITLETMTREEADALPEWEGW